MARDQFNSTNAEYLLWSGPVQDSTDMEIHQTVRALKEFLICVEQQTHK